ncbi:cellulase family glycosylhydrolase [Arenibacter sp. F26102]|uniref:cellulase family glycosylhydrolase n=1 Tax=Arenibacter sp. F26102 TaxID=2926416 RepID=UPI001FF3975E|nr:cellulase family glycosylhydrolase [Arenibacter sp. F26102]MCK0148227.1 cellulase family glycosylhydrolase [Arenibacter sp. F26102]
MLFRQIHVLLLVLFISTDLIGQTGLAYTYLDSKGKQFVPRGFVMNTEDGIGDIIFSDEDYLRAARLGANFQVIRLNMSKLGAWPGHQVDTTYYEKLDRLIELGAKYGMKTGFKMTVYGIKGFGDNHWRDLWLNKNNEQGLLSKAWHVLWERYKDHDSLYAYDLLNEPQRGNLDISYDALQRDKLVPLYRKLIDELQEVDRKKWAFFQPLLMEKNPDRAKLPIPFYEMNIPIERSKVMFAPHIYQLDLEKIQPWLDRYQKEAKLSKVPLFLGEWGSATYDQTDIDLLEQQRYARAYIKTAKIADSLGVGMIKAWFLGSRWKGTNPIGKFTWAIFKDKEVVGTAERRYITDIIARPYPSIIAGKLYDFDYNYAQRELKFNFRYNSNKGASEVFIGANRHYPDGFTISLNNGEWVAFYDPIESKDLKILTSTFNNGVKINWDERLQKLIIQQLPKDKEEYAVTISPGINN